MSPLLACGLLVIVSTIGYPIWWAAQWLYVHMLKRGWA